MDTHEIRKRMPVSALLDPKIVVPAIGSAFAKLDPRALIKNPVMFVVEVVAALTTVILLRDLVDRRRASIGFTFQIVLWLWFTVLFANFAEAVAEGRGKAQAEVAAKTRTEIAGEAADRLGFRQDTTNWFPAPACKVGDVVLVEAGDIIPSDGEVIEGIASVNEAAITGESAPVIREVRRRPLGRHRRHAGAVRLDHRAHHRGAGLDLPRPHDRAGRRRRAPEDAERDRAQHPARRA